jgi:hypothetical protein
MYLRMQYYDFSINFKKLILLQFISILHKNLRTNHAIFSLRENLTKRFRKFLNWASLALFWAWMQILRLSQTFLQLHFSNNFLFTQRIGTTWKLMIKKFFNFFYFQRHLKQTLSYWDYMQIVLNGLQKEKMETLKGSKYSFHYLYWEN